MRTSLLVGLAIVGVLGAGTVAASTVESFKTKANGLEAIFAIGDFCQAAFTKVNYAAAVLKFNGEKEIQQPLIFLEIDYINNCTGDHFILTGVSSDVEGKILGDLKGATLVANVPVADETGTLNTTFSVNLSFEGDGPLAAVSDKTKSKEGNVVMKSNFTFQSRPAEVTGTIVGALPPGSNQTVQLTQGPSFSGSIGSSRTGDITITKKH